MVDVMSPATRQRLLAYRAWLREASQQPMAPPAAPPTATFAPSSMSDLRVAESALRPSTRFFLRPHNAAVPRRVGPHMVVRGQWATSCFLPAYVRARKIHDTDKDAIVTAILEQCRRGPSDTMPDLETLSELERRVSLATTVLMRLEGIDMPMPPTPPFSRPPDADAIRQPWMRALITGWI